MTEYHGCDDLRKWLISDGFKISSNQINSQNQCTWYAYRGTIHAARECECNEGKNIQIVVRPFELLHTFNVDKWQSAEVDLTGESGGVWFKLTAYGLTSEELRARLPDIESNLVAAWNALLPIKK